MFFNPNIYGDLFIIFFIIFNFDNLFGFYKPLNSPNEPP